MQSKSTPPPRNAQCGYRGGHAYIGSQEQARDLKFAPDIPFWKLWKGFQSDLAILYCKGHFWPKNWSKLDQIRPNINFWDKDFKFTPDVALWKLWEYLQSDFENLHSKGHFWPKIGQNWPKLGQISIFKIKTSNSQHT